MEIGWVLIAAGWLLGILGGWLAGFETGKREGFIAGRRTRSLTHEGK